MASNHFPENSTKSFFDQLRDNACGHQVFFEGENTSLAYGDLFRIIDVVCALFEQRGFSAGDRVAIALDDDQHAIVAYVASMWFGLELSMIDPGLTPDECQKILELLEPDHLVVGPSCLTSWAFLNDEPYQHITKIIIDSDQYEHFTHKAGKTERYQPANRSFDDPHLIVLTSGTTGHPKGAVLTYKAILTQSLNMGAGIGFGADCRILNLFRLSQIGSIVNGVVLALLHGGTFVRPYQNFDFSLSRDLLSKIEQRPVTHFIFVPSLLSCLFRNTEAFVDAFSIPQFRYFITTAAPISDNLWRQVERRTSKIVINSFGSSEVNNVTFTSMSHADDRIGTIGHLLNAESRIVDQAGEDVSEGETGELWVRSDTRMSAYLNAPELTEQVLVDGWVKTGDLAYQSGDNLVYVGRCVESIISGGHTIYPTEINNLLLSHPDVVDACTFGKPHPEWGELVAACIVPNTPGLTAPQISRFLREQLSVHKLPRKIVFVDRIPLNDRGKVRMQDVQKLVS